MSENAQFRYTKPSDSAVTKRTTRMKRNGRLGRIKPYVPDVPKVTHSIA